MTAPRRRLLYVTPFSLLPAVEGHRKRMAMTFNAIREAGFEVHLLFIPREYEWCELFDPALYKEIMTAADLTFFCHATTPTPPKADVYTLDEWWPSHADEYCRWVFANHGYEMVFCNYVFMSRIFKFAERSAIKVIDSHDLFADRKQLLIANGLKPEFFYTDRESELAGMERADLVLAIKEQEAEYFRRNSDVRVITLPYYQDGPIAPAPPRARQPGEKIRFGFFGSANSINVKNIVEFSAFLDEQRPSEGYEFEFWLYGSLCKRLPENLPEFVKRIGFVDTVDEFYSGVDCVINPQYFSTGLKIKVAEALAYQAPLICHRHSFEGFGEPLHPAQDCADFEGVLAAMRAAARDPAYLVEVGRASTAVQARLVEECRRQLAKIFSGARLRLSWVYMFVDARAFNRSRLYRHLVEGFFVSFAGRHLVAMVAVDAASRASAEPEAAGGAWAAFQRKANRSTASLAFTTVEPGAACVFFDDPTAAGLPDNLRGGLVFVDAVRLARRLCGRAWSEWLAAAGRRHGLVRSVGPGVAAGMVATGDATEAVAIRYFRWLPWEMGVWTGADNHDLVEEIWVFADQRLDSRWEDWIRHAFPEFEVRVFREGCGAAAEVGCGVLTATDTVFGQRRAPRLVLRLTDHSGFDVIAEWCVANGVPCRDFTPYARAAAGENGGDIDALGAARLSDLVRPPRPAGLLQGAVASWAASGWEALAALIDSRGALEPARSGGIEVGAAVQPATARA